MTYVRVVSCTGSITSSDGAIAMTSFSTLTKELYRLLQNFDNLKSGSAVLLLLWIQNRLCNSFHIIGLSAHMAYPKICLAASRWQESDYHFCHRDMGHRGRDAMYQHPAPIFPCSVRSPQSLRAGPSLLRGTREAPSAKKQQHHIDIIEPRTYNYM